MIDNNNNKDLSKLAIILNFVILFAGAGVVWGVQRSDVDHLKQRITQVETTSKEGLLEVRDDIKYLRQEQSAQYREISKSLLSLQENYSNRSIIRRKAIYTNDN